MASIMRVELKLKRKTSVMQGRFLLTLNVRFFSGAYAIIKINHQGAVRYGAPLRLTCILNDSIEPPTYMFWYKDDRVINYDLSDGATVREGRLGTELIFPRAEPAHNGNYSCVPSNAVQADIVVTVQDASENRKKSSWEFFQTFIDGTYRFSKRKNIVVQKMKEAAEKNKKYVSVCCFL